MCISTNREAIYDMPVLSDAEVASLIQHGSCSDSFYFVGDKLIMHNKARYSYIPDRNEAGAAGSSGSSSSAADKRR